MIAYDCVNFGFQNSWNKGDGGIPRSLNKVLFQCKCDILFCYQSISRVHVYTGIAPVTLLRKEDTRLSTLDCANAKGQCKIRNDRSSTLLLSTRGKAVPNRILLCLISFCSCISDSSHSKLQGKASWSNSHSKDKLTWFEQCIRIQQWRCLNFWNQLGEKKKMSNKLITDTTLDLVSVDFI